MASDGLEGYQIYVRNQPYEPEEPIGTDPQPTVTITWPYQDDTTDPEVCVTALYPDGSDDDTDPDESERTCITVHQSDFGPSTSPSGSPGAGATPDGGGSSQPKEEESP